VRRIAHCVSPDRPCSGELPEQVFPIPAAPTDETVLYIVVDGPYTGGQLMPNGRRFLARSPSADPAALVLALDERNRRSSEETIRAHDHARQNRFLRTIPTPLKKKTNRIVWSAFKIKSSDPSAGLSPIALPFQLRPLYGGPLPTNPPARNLSAGKKTGRSVRRPKHPDGPG